MGSQEGFVADIMDLYNGQASVEVTKYKAVQNKIVTELFEDMVNTDLAYSGCTAQFWLLKIHRLDVTASDHIIIIESAWARKCLNFNICFVISVVLNFIIKTTKGLKCLHIPMLKKEGNEMIS